MFEVGVRDRCRREEDLPVLSRYRSILLHVAAFLLAVLGMPGHRQGT
jgi:hypothetical protein